VCSSTPVPRRKLKGCVQEAFIDAEDIAEPAVAALTEDGHAGRCYELSGPRLMTFGDAVLEIARAAGRDTRYVPLTPEVYADEQRAQGVPEEWVRWSVGLYEHVRSGGLASLGDGVRRSLGRAPRDFAGRRPAGRLDRLTAGAPGSPQASTCGPPSTLGSALEEGAAEPVGVVADAGQGKEVSAALRTHPLSGAATGAHRVRSEPREPAPGWLCSSERTADVHHFGRYCAWRLFDSLWAQHLRGRSCRSEIRDSALVRLRGPPRRVF
jgi:hypothetical protein